MSFSYDKSQESANIQNLKEDTYNIGDNTPKQEALLVLAFMLALQPDVVDAREILVAPHAYLVWAFLN